MATVNDRLRVIAARFALAFGAIAAFVLGCLGPWIGLDWDPARREMLLSFLTVFGAIWLAESAGALTGYLIVVLVASVEHQGLMGEIDEFFVLPEARSQGVGARLLAAAEAALTRRGCVRPTPTGSRRTTTRFPTLRRPARTRWRRPNSSSPRPSSPMRATSRPAASAMPSSARTSSCHSNRRTQPRCS